MPPSFDALARKLAADEPRTTLALGALLGTKGHRRQLKIVTAGPGGRSVAPVVRVEPGRWVAFPVLADSADAPALAAAIEDSVAIGVEGAARDIEPLLPHLRRRIGELSMERMLRPFGPIDWRPPTAPTRIATRLDLSALRDLYEGYELGGRTEATMDRGLIEAIDRFGVVVYDSDEAGRLDAAIVVTRRTPQFLEWSMLTVRPEARKRGYAWAVADRAIALSLASGLGFTYMVGPGNPMTFPPELGAVDIVTLVDLSLPRRFKGEPRLWRLWLRTVRRRQRRTLIHLRAEPPSPGRDTAGPEAGGAQMS